MRWAVGLILSSHHLEFQYLRNSILNLIEFCADNAMLLLPTPWRGRLVYRILAKRTPDPSMREREQTMNEERVVSGDKAENEDQQVELSLRHKWLREYIGQKKVKENLGIFMQAARKRVQPLDHVLLYGPPGLGKTTLSYIISNEMQSDIKSTAGPVIEKAGDLAALLTNLSEGDVLFIDEIHRLNPAIEEILYPAMEDYQL